MIDSPKATTTAKTKALTQSAPKFKRKVRKGKQQGESDAGKQR
jgi:hypothetical protein